ncbi:MAG: hypothetical protein M3380_10565, partial [Chloroflexota bacterium]|nr:hypothetical protein [Chloroflexota bacterium]
MKTEPASSCTKTACVSETVLSETAHPLSVVTCFQHPSASTAKRQASRPTASSAGAVRRAARSCGGTAGKLNRYVDMVCS